MYANNMKKIEVGKTKKIIREIPLFIAKHILQFSLLLLLIALIVGVNVFYKYNVLATKTALKKLDDNCPLNESSYNRVLEVWDKHDLMFERAGSKQYYDVFSGGIID